MGNYKLPQRKSFVKMVDTLLVLNKFFIFKIVNEKY